MKDGTTHLAYKAEHVVDLKTELLLAATVYRGDRGDTETMVDSVVQARMNIIEAGSRQTSKNASPTKVITRRRLWRL